MRQRFFFPFLVLPMVVPWAAALPQAANSPPRAELNSKSRLSKRDEKILLATAEQGDASSQMWLGSAYEQGRFAKTDFPEALKWFFPKSGKPVSNDSHASARASPWDPGPAHDFHAPANCIVPATFKPDQRA